jgi:hypothetical protein
VTFFFERLAGLGSRIVELRRLTDDDWAGADYENLHSKQKGYLRKDKIVVKRGMMLLGMKRFLAGVALSAAIGSASAQNFAPRIGDLSGGKSGDLLQSSPGEIEENARRLAETRTFTLPNGPLAPSSSLVQEAEEPAPLDSPATPLIPIMGCVLGVTVVSIGLGTKSRWSRSRA